jgi:multisubunit Na+/H+ antiporter MnhE subunit
MVFLVFPVLFLIMGAFWLSMNRDDEIHYITAIAGILIALMCCFFVCPPAVKIAIAIAILAVCERLLYSHTKL